MPIGTVRVRLSDKRMDDGATPRIPRPRADGPGRPGDYIGFRVLRADDGTFQGWEETGEAETLPDIPTVRRMIQDGYIIVDDDRHPLACLNAPRTESAVVSRTNKASGSTKAAAVKE